MALAFPRCASLGVFKRCTGSQKICLKPQLPYLTSQKFPTCRRTNSTLPNAAAESIADDVSGSSLTHARTRSPLPVTSSLRSNTTRGPAHSPQYDPSRAPTTSSTFDDALSSSLSEQIQNTLPLFAAQTPHYATIHIYGKPYLITEGDTIRLPFLMHGVAPGDVLRLNRVTILGSRDWTLRSGSMGFSVNSKRHQTRMAPHLSAQNAVADGELLDKSLDDIGNRPIAESPNGMNSDNLQPTGLPEQDIKHYLDERLYMLRAVVVGTESEPLRIKKKKKQRNRHTRTVRSKHRFTILRIKQLTVARGVETEL